MRCTLAIIIYCLCNYTVFLVHPTSIAAVDGSTVEFTCTVNDSESLQYIVNDTLASLESVTSKGFKQLSSDELAPRVFRRNLSVTVSSLYNNTEIWCRAVGSIANSNKATLTVQGNTHAYMTINNHYCLSFQVHYLQLIYQIQ